MTHLINHAFKILARFWLEEIKASDAETITALPELAQTLPNIDSAALTDLAAEYQRLFGFNLPPYESVFIDPSVMLMAPATERVQSLYRQAQWSPPANTRTGAPDHLGLELLAYADWLEAGHTGPARNLHARHLALWVPPFVVTLRRLAPPPFYADLGSLTLDLLLATLPDNPLPPNTDPFPNLPPPPVYTGSNEPPPDAPDAPDEESTESVGLRGVVRRLLTPCQVGLFLTRQDIAQLSQALDLPASMGERFKMLETLFRSARQYDLWPLLLEQLGQLVQQAENEYRHLAGEYPAWQPYANAWLERLESTQTLLAELRQSGGVSN